MFMLSLGENANWVAQMMGLASTEMLFKRYAKFIPNLTRSDGSAFLSSGMDTFWTLPKKKKGLPIRNPSVGLVAGARFELATFGL